MDDKKEKKMNSDDRKTGFIHNGQPMYFDENDRLYYIDDDGNREYKIKLADVLNDEQQEEIAAGLVELFTNKKDALSDEFIEIITQGLLDKLYASQDLINELRDLEQFINAAAKKDGGTGLTYSVIMSYTAGELLDMLEDPNSNLYKTIEEARTARDRINAQKAGRAERLKMKQAAADSGAIMEIKGGNYPVFSEKELWDAFAPGRICKMGTLPADYIDRATGLVKKRDFEPGEIEDLDALDIPAKALLLLNGIMKNSVDNITKDFVKGGQITFYVKGVLQAVTDDPRELMNDQQLNLERKTAGALYLENLFKPLQGYIGLLPNGSRYSVFNYVGYDANTDTMAVQMPYLYQLWKFTQQEYFNGQKRIEAAKENKKRPVSSDYPLKINDYFKGKALNENETTLEIAIYITNVMLAAGKGDNKKSEITYKKIINQCPRLKQRLDEIAARPTTETLPDGKKRNNTAIYNTELRKIKNAFALIQNPDKCDALKRYEFIDIKPATKNKKGIFILNTPTKSMINEKIVIKWRTKDDEN